MEGFPRLYAIVDRAAIEACHQASSAGASRGVGVGALAQELRDAGVRLVQYRDKLNAPQEILRTCAEIAEVFEGAGTTLILNDRADLAVLAGWDGVHVGQGDLPVEAARRVMGDPTHRTMGLPDEGATRNRVVGVSTHTVDQVRAAEASSADYVAVGPVFRTGSKADAEPVVGLEGVRRARALTTKPLVAIGGISLENARSVVEAGADSIAVIGALLAKGERPGDVARDFLRILG